MNLSSFLLIAASVAGASPSDVLAARSDAKTGRNYYYLTTAAAPKELQEDLANAIRFVIPSTSRALILERHVPEKISETLWRLRLDGLLWDPADYYSITKHYPYKPAHIANPLIVRAEWLLMQLTDGRNSQAYRLLLYGRRRKPNNINDVLTFWGVSKNRTNFFGLITDDSPVAISRLRWIENRPTNRRETWWLTRDSAVIDQRSDPLEFPDGRFKHDAEEHIGLIRKVDQRRGKVGAAMVFDLANADGKLQDVAPANVVADYNRFRGAPEIVNPGSCIICHGGGLNQPKTNEQRKWIENGGEEYRDPKSADFVDLFHYSDTAGAIREENKLFRQFARSATGERPEACAASFARVVAFYDRPIDLAQAAREMYASPAELRLAIAYASERGALLGKRLAGLAHGGVISRAAFEQKYQTMLEVVALWKTH